jgi:UrcA family protein
MNIIKSIPVRSLALASLVCVLGASPGWAGAPPSTTVRFADLDLNTSAGANALYHRIRVAAKDVCGPHGPSSVEYADWLGCVDGATGDAVRAVHSPLLTALYTGQRATPVTAMLVK